MCVFDQCYDSRPWEHSQFLPIIHLVKERKCEKLSKHTMLNTDHHADRKKKEKNTPEWERVFKALKEQEAIRLQVSDHRNCSLYPGHTDFCMLRRVMRKQNPKQDLTETLIWCFIVQIFTLNTLSHALSWLKD